MTITSQDEQGFILNKLLPPADYSREYYWMGGTDAATQFNWKWLTGEPWNYANWASDSDASSYDYLAIENYAHYLGSGRWFSGKATDTALGYICEWSAQNYIDTALVPDVNGNGVDDIAVLFVDYKTGKHTVQIKDRAGDKLISTLTFATNFNPPQGLVVLEDIIGNGVAEIGVLFTNAGYPSVTIKDAKNNTTILKSRNFLSTSYKPRAVNSSPDINGNGASEITVLGVHKRTGKALTEVRDSKTGLVLGL